MDLATYISYRWPNRVVTQTRKNLQLVLITLSGFKPNIWSEGLVDVSLSADEIFDSVH